MARLIIAGDVPRQIKLLKKIIAEDTARGANSQIRVYLTKKGIVLSADNTIAEAVAAMEAERFGFSKSSQNHRQKRDLLFDPIMSHTRNYYQYLKVFFKPNFLETGEWGAPITDSGRINYSSNFLEQTTMFGTLQGKYDGISTNNPLDPYLTQHNLVIADQAEIVSDAIDEHDSFNAASNSKEAKTEELHTEWNPVLAHIEGIGNFLMKLYKGSEKELGLWGFTVDNSPKAPKTRKSTLKAGQSGTFSGIVVGGTLKNTSTVDIKVYKGKTATGAFATVLPGEMLGMLEGYSFITVVNTSTLVKATFTILAYQ